MPSTTVTFNGSSSGADAVINGPASDQPVVPLPRYLTGLSQDGTRYSYKMNSATNRVWTLNFQWLTDQMKADLETFYYDEAGGPSSTFTYDHTDDNSYTARFVNTSLPFTRAGSNLWSCSVQLEILGVIS